MESKLEIIKLDTTKGAIGIDLKRNIISIGFLMKGAVDDATNEDEREKTDTLDKSRKYRMHKICKIETKETRIGAINKYLEPILAKIRISNIEDNGNPKNKESALAINRPNRVSLEKY